MSAGGTGEHPPVDWLIVAYVAVVASGFGSRRHARSSPAVEGAMPSHTLRRAAALFLPAAAVLVIAAGFVVAAVQQDLRIGANDVPLQLAEDGVRALDAGTTPAAVVGSGSVALESSLAPFVAVYDGQGALVASSGTLEGRPPAPPAGIFAEARSAGSDTVTWQPRAGVRIALVAMPWSGGTIVAGTSLRVIESRIERIEVLVATGVLAGLLVLALTAVAAARLWPAPRDGAA